LYLAVVQCLEADELLSSAGVSAGHSHRLSVEDFMHICPILIVQLDSHVCSDEHNDSNEHGHGHAEELPKWHSSPAAGMTSVMLQGRI